MSIKCCRCGALTEIEQSFHKTRRSFRRQIIFYCPLCWAKQQQRFIQFSFLAWVILGLASVVVVVLAAENSDESIFAWIELNVIFGYLLMILQILPHEFGHALMAHLLGWRVFKIAIGWGRNLHRFRWRGFVFEINAIPTNGMTWAASKSANCYRLKQFLYVLAGPMTNTVLLGSILYLVPASQLLAPLPGTKLFLWPAVIASGTVLLIVCLYPFRQTTGSISAKVDSDGLCLLTAFFLSSAQIRQRQTIYFLLEGLDSYLQYDYKKAKQWHEQGLKLYPEDIPNRCQLALMLLFVEEFHASRSQWLRLLEREDLSPASRPTIVNNLAWTDMMIGGKEMLAEADWLSKELVDVQPWRPTFQGTRGSVLIEMGEADAGLPLVRRAFEANDDPRLKALNACYLALGEWQRGNRAESRRQRDLARKLDSQCILLDKVDQALAAAERLP